MSNCIYCNQPAGFLHKYHKDCLSKFNEGKDEIITLSKESAVNDNDYINSKNKISLIASNNFISDQLMNELIISGWEKAVETAFEDYVLTEEEENKLFNFAKTFSFEQKDLDKNGYYSKVIKGAVLREIMEGKITERINLNGSLPFNFQKGENLIWVFQNVDYYEQKTKRQYVGGYQGVSIRVAKGVYYRTGGFKGNPVETTQTLHIDNGLFAVTNKHVYFSGNAKNFRIPYNKIISFKPYSDGIEIQKDTSTAKPQSFLTGDGWFTYNLITNLANLN